MKNPHGLRPGADRFGFAAVGLPVRVGLLAAGGRRFGNGGRLAAGPVAGRIAAAGNSRGRRRRGRAARDRPAVGTPGPEVRTAETGAVGGTIPGMGEGFRPCRANSSSFRRLRRFSGSGGYSI